MADVLNRIDRATPEWHTRARCRAYPTEMFFADASEDEALAVCNGVLPCPVRDDCLARALFEESKFGVQGGKTAKERRKLLAATERLIPGPGRAKVAELLDELQVERTRSQLARIVELEPAYVGRILKMLLAEGLVTRRESDWPGKGSCGGGVQVGWWQRTTTTRSMA